MTTTTTNKANLPITVFVYGSLKRGHGNNRLLGDQEHAKFLGTEFLRGNYRLVDLSAFPGILENKEWPRAEILGELYAVSVEALASLDILEGNKFFYTRKKVQVGGDYRKGVTIGATKAWCYFLPTDEYGSRTERLCVDMYQCWRPSDEEKVLMARRAQEARQEAA